MVPIEFDALMCIWAIWLMSRRIFISNLDPSQLVRIQHYFNTFAARAYFVLYIRSTRRDGSRDPIGSCPGALVAISWPGLPLCSRCPELASVTEWSEDRWHSAFMEPFKYIWSLSPSWHLNIVSRLLRAAWILFGWQVYVTAIRMVSMSIMRALPGDQPWSSLSMSDNVNEL